MSSMNSAELVKAISCPWMVTMRHQVMDLELVDRIDRHGSIAVGRRRRNITFPAS